MYNGYTYIATQLQLQKAGEDHKTRVDSCECLIVNEFVFECISLPSHENNQANTRMNLFNSNREQSNSILTKRKIAFHRHHNSNRCCSQCFHMFVCLWHVNLAFILHT
ncbi:hypothetical protein BLOT_007368 [Blomia tropicalis]|nr:hypothetical protein BLOT_007368 [Blomia tropicalis]